jgi:hypothetical protein
MLHKVNMGNSVVEEGKGRLNLELGIQFLTPGAATFYAKEPLCMSIKMKLIRLTCKLTSKLM